MGLSPRGATTTSCTQGPGQRGNAEMGQARASPALKKVFGKLKLKFSRDSAASEGSTGGLGVGQPQAPWSHSLCRGTGHCTKQNTTKMLKKTPLRVKKK